MKVVQRLDKGIFFSWEKAEKALEEIVSSGMEAFYRQRLPGMYEVWAINTTDSKSEK